ncbi:MAG: twin-arginine translocation pathway signal protein [Pseudomonadota bacterium]
MATRRGVLKLVGGGVVLAAGSVGGFVALNQPSRSARAPWRDAGRETEYRRRALSYALLAPNPHNRQSWLVSLDGEDALTLYCDLGRRLPETDPYDRQITIGCGAFLELLRLAAAEDGYLAEITPFPDGEDMATLDARPVARVSFTPNAAEPDPLFAHVLDRRSNKEVYEARDVDPGALVALTGSARVFGVSADSVGNTDLAARLRDLTWRAHVKEVTTPAANMESVDLMRIGAREVAENPDGIELEGPMIAAGRLIGMVNREQLADPASPGFKQGLALYEAMAQSARAFAWLANDGDTRIEQLNAGRAYLRFNLTATELGLGIHPWSQALQEYPEMSDLYDEAHDLIGGGKRLQMLVRVGYAPDIMPTPRRGLDAHLMS